VIHGRYSQIGHTRLRALLSDLERKDRNTMDLEPDVRLMRALLIDYVNRYDEFVEALITWYRERVRQAKHLPPPPLRVLDLHEAAGLLEGASRIVERMHKINREGSVTLDSFRRLMETMGMTVARHVKDTEILQKIEKEWESLVIGPSPRRNTEQDVEDGEDWV